MHVIDHSPQSWFLVQDGEALLLDVNVSHSFVGFSLLIELNESERAAYAQQGTPAIDKLAETIQRADTPYHARNLSSARGQEVNKAIAAFQAAAARAPAPAAPKPAAPTIPATLRNIDAGVLNITYLETGPADGWPVLLMHGFPYDIHAYDACAPLLAAQGARVIVPYLRGFGPTRFLSAHTPRSGEQAALGADLLALLDALRIDKATLAGYDWGGRAACITAALWPARVQGLVSYQSYNIHDIARAAEPDTPEKEHGIWYQYYFHGDRGRAGLEKDRRAFCRLLWRLWSPTWIFEDPTYAQTAPSFDNPDFVDVVIHSYRHRFALVPGDPAYADIERTLATQPPITVPTVTLDGADDGIRPGGTAAHAKHFTGRHEHRVIKGAGHNLPQENPEAFVEAVMRVRGL